MHDITTTSEENGNAFGISVYGTSQTPINKLVINGNELYNMRTGNSETLDVDGNVTNFESPTTSFTTMTTSAST